MFALTINRKIWARGDSEQSRLLRLNPEQGRRQCCVGIYLTALGVPDEALLNVGIASDMHDEGVPSKAAWLCDSTEPVFHSTVDAKHLYSINDDPDVQDEEREQYLTEVFGRNGVALTFED